MSWEHRYFPLNLESFEVPLKKGRLGLSKKKSFSTLSRKKRKEPWLKNIKKGCEKLSSLT